MTLNLIGTGWCVEFARPSEGTGWRRQLMFDAAEQAGPYPDRVSFVAALRISRRSIAQQGAFPP